MLRSIFTRLQNELGVRLGRGLTADQMRRLELLHLHEQLQPLIAAGTLHVELVHKKIVLHLCTDAAFKGQTSELTPVGRDALCVIAQALSHVPQHVFEVDGHTDIGSALGPSFKNNWALAAARVESALRVLTESGLPRARLSSLSYGEFHPAATNDTPEGRAENRRIEIILVPSSQTPASPGRG